MCIDCVLASPRIAQDDPGRRTPSPRWFCYRDQLKIENVWSCRPCFIAGAENTDTYSSLFLLVRWEAYLILLIISVLYPRISQEKTKYISHNSLLTFSSLLFSISSTHRFEIIVTIDFLSYVWPFVLFKILVQICTIITHDLFFFSNKMNHNKNIFNF
jgi:hypothetical protein